MIATFSSLPKATLATMTGWDSKVVLFCGGMKNYRDYL